MPITSSLPFLASVLDVVRPSKSPHLVASFIGVVSLLVIGHNVDNEIRYWLIAIPVTMALVLVVMFSFKDRIVQIDKDATKTELENIENEFKFARSMGIGSAILALLLTGILPFPLYDVKIMDEVPFYFAWGGSQWSNYLHS